MWRREWDGWPGRWPTWENLTNDYKRFIQYQRGNPGEAIAAEWWNSRFDQEKREYFDPLPTPQQIKGMQCGNQYVINAGI